MDNVITVKTVKTVKMVAANGRRIRQVTRVTIGAQVVTFMEKLSKGRAIAQAQAVLERG